MRKILKFLKYVLIFFVVAGGALFIYVKFFVTVVERDLYAFVPDDFIYMVESKEPIDNWNEFSETEVWKHLSQNESFAEIDEMADYLDSLIQSSPNLFSLVGEKPLLISSHMTQPRDYDFLYLLDLKGAAKLGAFMDVLQLILDKLVVKTTKQSIGEHSVYLIGEADDTVYLTVVDNILLCSYTRSLIEKAIEQHNEPFFPEDERFLTMQKKTSNDGLCKVYLNYSVFDKFMGVYMTDTEGMIDAIAKSLQYSTNDFRIEDSYVELDGYTSSLDSFPSMINALKNTNGSKIRAPQILPARTSFFFSINFDDFGEYYQELDAVMKLDEKEYADFKKNQTRIENFLNITLEEHIFSWIGQELTISMLPVDKKGRKQSYLAFFHAPDLTKAKSKLDYMVKRFKKNVLNPIKFRQYAYKNFDVNYLEMKGFFKIFLGKLFGKFDKPQYIALDEYVVFSNDTTALHRVIDDHLRRNTLQNDQKFRKFFKNFSSHSNYFSYINAEEMYPYLPTLGNIETGKSIRKNKRYIVCFPQVGMQFREKSPFYRSYMRLEFQPQN